MPRPGQDLAPDPPARALAESDLHDLLGIDLAMVGVGLNGLLVGLIPPRRS
jgi:hypothetical protein